MSETAWLMDERCVRCGHGEYHWAGSGAAFAVLTFVLAV